MYVIESDEKQKTLYHPTQEAKHTQSECQGMNSFEDVIKDRTYNLQQGHLSKC